LVQVRCLVNGITAKRRLLNYIRKQIGLFDREVPKQALALTRQKLLDALDGVGTVEQNCQRLGVDQRIRAI